MKTRSHRYTQMMLPDPTAAQLEAAQTRRRLEEAAPDLLAVLKEIIAEGLIADRQTRGHNAYAAARAAIAKAEGKS